MVFTNVYMKKIAESNREWVYRIAFETPISAKKLFKTIYTRVYI